MRSSAQDHAKLAPKDLHSLQYASWLCENTLGIPAAKSNLDVVSQAIESVAKSRFNDAKWKHPSYTAFIWLDRQVQFAKIRGIQTNHLFFLNGDYNEVTEPPKELPPFDSCGKCTLGWTYIEKDGKKGVTRCECWKAWRASI